MLRLYSCICFSKLQFQINRQAPICLHIIFSCSSVGKILIINVFIFFTSFYLK
nr:MAG TPA: hypothetical protein [Caudoviricetes sp.]